MRHIHADHMIASANDTTIEWQYKLPEFSIWQYISPKPSIWNDCVDGIPAWHPESEYRQRPAPNPHQAMMDQAEADPSIQWQLLSSDEVTWRDVSPSWIGAIQYRQKPAPHPHQALIDQAWADHSIEWQHSSQGSDWSDCLHLSGPQWHIGFNYRQKPTEPKMVEMWQWAVRDRGLIYSTQHFYRNEAELVGVCNPHQIICRIEGSKITVPEVSQ
jgi:hypothetical protein